MTKAKPATWEAFEMGDVESRFNGYVTRDTKTVAYTVFVKDAVRLAECANALVSVDYPRYIGERERLLDALSWRKSDAYRKGVVAGFRAAGFSTGDGLEALLKELDELTELRERERNQD